MSKLIGEPVKVHEDKDKLPQAFIWRKRLYHVQEITGWWREPADWRCDNTLRFFIRVVAKNSSPGAYELYHLGHRGAVSEISCGDGKAFSGYASSRCHDGKDCQKV